VKCLGVTSKPRGIRLVPLVNLRPNTLRVSYIQSEGKRRGCSPFYDSSVFDPAVIGNLTFVSEVAAERTYRRSR
jgi:hypothetical protein